MNRTVKIKADGVLITVGIYSAIIKPERANTVPDPGIITCVSGDTVEDRIKKVKTTLKILLDKEKVFRLS